MSKKKPTPGERIANVPEHGDPLYHDMTDVELATARALARRVDAAIRREAKKAVAADRIDRGLTPRRELTFYEHALLTKNRKPRSRKP
jgi:hypothetical protein